MSRGTLDAVPALPGRLVRAWRALERFAESRRAAPALFFAALAVYGAVSLALPVSGGRDLGRYLMVYAQLFHEHVVFPYVLVSRPPGTPLVVGGMLDAGPVATEVGTALLYAFSILAWCCVARRFGPAAVIATAVALLLYPGYVLLFHTLSSDALFAAMFALFAVLLARALEEPSVARAAALGAGIAALVLVRPVAQVLLVFAFVPLLAAPTWRGRLQGTAAFALAALCRSRVVGSQRRARRRLHPQSRRELPRCRSSAPSSPTGSSSPGTGLRRRSSRVPSHAT